MTKKSKEPSLLRQIVSIHFEQMKRRKALKLLSKQSWSVDFLSVLLVKAAKLSNNNVSLVITNKDGESITLKVNDAVRSAAAALDDSILNHLDDEVALNKFISLNSTR